MDRGLEELWNTWMIGVFVTFIRVVYGGMIYARKSSWRLQALSKTYRNLLFLPVVSWNPGKKTNVISPTPMRWWRMHYNYVHLLFMSCCSILVLYREDSVPFNFALRLKFNCEPQWPWQTDPRRYFMHLLVYPNAKITHICSIWYFYVKIDICW